MSTPAGHSQSALTLSAPSMMNSLFPIKPNRTSSLLSVLEFLSDNDSDSEEKEQEGGSDGSGRKQSFLQRAKSCVKFRASSKDDAVKSAIKRQIKFSHVCIQVQFVMLEANSSLTESTPPCSLSCAGVLPTNHVRWEREVRVDYGMGSNSPQDCEPHNL